MIKCPKCGLNIDDDSITCPYCGAVLEDYKDELESNKNIENVQMEQESSEEEIHEDDIFEEAVQDNKFLSEDNGDDPASGWFLLGFLVSPILGIVLYSVFRHRRPKIAQRCIKGAISGFILLAVLYTLYIIIYAILIKLGYSFDGLFIPKNSVSEINFLFFK